MNEQPKKKKRRTKAEILITDAMSDIQFVTLNSDFGEFEIVSMAEMPIDVMLTFVNAEQEDKMPVMLDMMKMSLLNPNDWNRIESESFGKVNRLIKQWMDKSGDI